MEAILRPQNTQDVEAMVQWAASEDKTLEIVGQGSKRELGRPVQAAHVLDLSGLSGVKSYKPQELVLSVKAGTPIAEVEKLVGDNEQELAFEPMDYGPLFGRSSGRGTIGGVLGANLSGPKWIKVRSARKHVLGMEAVTGRGEIFCSGENVGNDATGYDLPRTLCGSYGTLAVATSVTLRINRKPEASVTFVLLGLDDLDGVKALCEAMGPSEQVSGAAHLPSWVDGADSKTLLRLEGTRAEVGAGLKTLKDLLGGYGPHQTLEKEETELTWKNVRDLQAFARSATPVWRISVAPTAGPQLVARLKAAIELDALYDWSGGLVWLTCTDGDTHQAKIRMALEAVGGGHATLVRADLSARSNLDVFQPQPAPLAALSRRLKEQFDPKGLLNPGRMVNGM